jgi:hypothetical protein
MTTAYNDNPTPPSILGNTPQQQKETGAKSSSDAGAMLAEWIMARVNRWRSVRDQDNLSQWDEYYRIWRGKWSPEDKNRSSERSRIVAPALAQAIDLTHAEIVEAVFGRDRWFDIPDDLQDKDKSDAETNRDLLDEDMANAGVPDALIKALQIGTIYGTGAVKISTEMRDVTEITPDNKERTVTEPIVVVYPIDVRELVPDPAADNVEDMLGIAHETVVPFHEVKEKQMSGFFFDADIGRVALMDSTSKIKTHEGSSWTYEDSVFVTEYHGKAPLKYMLMLDAQHGDPKGADKAMAEAMDLDEDVLIETICVIGNQNALLRAKRNPFWGQDRSIVCYQHETVPSEFWGRGVAEKGYNPQKALDAEIRMRIDTLALIASPMVAADKSRLPRGFDMRIWPGKEWPTVGDPKEVLMPFNFGQINPATFDQGADLERMVQVGTGAMDMGQSLSQGSRRDTAAGTAIMAGGFIKRSKRTMYNIEHQLLRPLLTKIMHRYMQFRPEKYKADFKFNVKGAMGIMAREFEQSNLQQLYSVTTPEEGPVRLMLLREIFNSSSSPNKLAMTKAIDQMLAPPDPKVKQEQEMMKQLGLRKLMAEVNELENKALNQGAQAAEHAAKAQGVVLEGQIKDDELVHDAARIHVEASEASTYAKQVQIQSQDKARADALKSRSLDIQERKIDVQERQANKPKG